MYTVLSCIINTVRMYVLYIQQNTDTNVAHRTSAQWMCLLESLQALVESVQLFCYHGDELLVVWHQLHGWHGAGKVVLQEHQGTGGEGRRGAGGEKRGEDSALYPMPLYTTQYKNTRSRNVHTCNAFSESCIRYVRTYIHTVRM